ncbi:hypothetical protein EPUS_03153 [Endocarpon pusillum Z07020]|uniref:Uncharacterized protein n=1 Tax=Endocarpon pusillum (strain Z07020 / HMAS-L-300199) TaxID=1263415 RepID=U1HS18_ENDPU|nr:uncharacterized protein EPUS_03153 [Endocarpon pusillum Z07020]ERF73320.1 hypothetical protein EPUS_03153 [Endocarpon pusillum Z07020]
MYPRASLAGLPTEIRLKIFSLVIQPNELNEADREKKWLTEHLGELVAIHYSEHRPPRLIKSCKGEPGWQLLRVSRTCYDEAAPMLYEKQGFYLFNDYDWSMWWRTQPFVDLPSFELFHTQHLIPYGFAFIRELAFQPTPEISKYFVKAIERNFPSLHTLRAFRHIYMHNSRLVRELREVWVEFHRFVLLAALVITSNHSKLKYAKWSDQRIHPDADAKDTIRTMTVKLNPDNMLLSGEAGLLDLKRISEQPLSDARVWSDAVKDSSLRIEDFFAVGAEI